MVPQGLGALISEFGISFAVVAPVAGGATDLLGDGKIDPIFQDLLYQLFGSDDAVAALNRSLEGQIMPRSWSQGEASCLICKPTEDIVVGLMYRESRDVIEEHRWGKEVDQRVGVLWESP